MLKYLQVVVLVMNFEFVLGGDCFGKHNFPVNDKNFPVLKRNIGDIHETGFSAIPNDVYLANNGYSIFIIYTYENINVTISGGPYGEDEYQLEGMYFNWLKKNHTASNAFPIELHLVFYNRIYESIKNATGENYGITIWSFRYGKNENRRPKNNFYGILKDIPEPDFVYANRSKKFCIPLHDIIDLQMDYYVYQGRVLSNFLHCGPVVIWVEFSAMLKINKREFKLFQKLLNPDSKTMLSKPHVSIPPNGTIYHNTNMEESPGWEPFNETLNDNLAIRNNGHFIKVRFIMITGLIMVLN